MSKAPSKARRGEAKTSPPRTAAAKAKRTSKAEDNTIKATFYLNQDTVNRLEESWLQLRRISEAADRGSITKSLIVRLAIEIALEDLAARGSSSPLAKRLDQR